MKMFHVKHSAWRISIQGLISTSRPTPRALLSQGVLAPRVLAQEVFHG